MSARLTACNNTTSVSTKHQLKAAMSINTPLITLCQKTGDMIFFWSNLPLTSRRIAFYSHNFEFLFDPKYPNLNWKIQLRINGNRKFQRSGNPRRWFWSHHWLDLITSFPPHGLVVNYDIQTLLLELTGVVVHIHIALVPNQRLISVIHGTHITDYLITGQSIVSLELYGGNTR